MEGKVDRFLYVSIMLSILELVQSCFPRAVGSGCEHTMAHRKENTRESIVHKLRIGWQGVGRSRVLSKRSAVKGGNSKGSM
jgi:hypothetical protein